jgi:tetratricopeptide (TPR) repeat protein
MHSFMGWLFFQSGNLEEALAQYSAALELDENDNLSRANAGLLLLELGGPVEAIEQLQWVVDVEPTLLPAQHGLGRALRKLHRYDLALEHYRQARQVHPEDPDILFNLGSILASWPTGGLGDAQEALQVAEQLAAIEATHPRSLDLMGMALAQSGRHREAVDLARRAARAYAAIGEEELARVAQERLRLYARGKPYRDPQARGE